MLTIHTDSRGGHNRINADYQFFRLWSASMSYVLGFIFADGTIEDVQKSSRTCYLAITSTDLSILEKIRNCMLSEHKLYKRIGQLITYPNGKQYASKEGYILRIGSKQMFNDLLSLGLKPRKSLTILFPNVPQKYLSFFIRGYFDGDGCLTLRKGKYPRIIFTSGSMNFLKGLALALSKALDLDTYSISTQVKRKNPCYNLYYSNLNSRKILEFMYKNLKGAPYLERKYLIYRNLIKQQDNHSPTRPTLMNSSTI